MFENKTMDKKPQHAPTVAKIPFVEDIRLQKTDPVLCKRLEDTKIVEKVSAHS